MCQLPVMLARQGLKATFRGAYIGLLHAATSAVTLLAVTFGKDEKSSLHSLLAVINHLTYYEKHCVL